MIVSAQGQSVRGSFDFGFAYAQDDALLVDGAVEDDLNPPVTFGDTPL